MRLVYGSYAHSDSECIVTIQREALENEGGQLYGTRETWDVQGKLHASTQAALTTAINALIAAYDVQGQNLTLLENSGATARQLLNASAHGGIRVVRKPSFPEGDGAEYTTYRSYSLSLEAEIHSANVEVLEFQETISTWGGGPEYGFQRTANGPPVKYLAHAATEYQATQRGQARGRTRYPVPPGPLWPADLMRSPRYDLTSPRRMLAHYVDWVVTWEYEFASVYPLLGGPTLWR